MSKIFRIFSSLLLLLGGCSTLPEGPGMMALPGTGKNFEQFRYDDASCRQYAQSQIGTTDTNDAGASAGVKSAVVGTLLGAAIGAVGDGSRGASGGAAAGMMMGSMMGAGAAQSTGYSFQRRYDHAYIQCMYAKGHRVPVQGQMQSMPMEPVAPPQPQNAPAPSAFYPPPPPVR